MAAELAGRRARELAQRIAALGAGTSVSERDVAVARARAKESAQRAGLARSRARSTMLRELEAHEGAADMYGVTDDDRAAMHRDRAEAIRRQLAEAAEREGRYQPLVEVVQAVNADLSDDDVLHRIVELTCDLVRARYGMAIVVDEEGRPERFVQVGSNEHAAQRIGHIPDGKGLIGELLSYPDAIRLRHLADDPRAAGFPPHHPAIDSFLGAPIQGDDRIFGALAFGDSLRGSFELDDERLVNAVAAAIGVRWSNARLQGETTQRGRWFEALADVQAELLRVDGNDPLETIARRTSEISGADVVTVELIRPENTSVSVEVAVGDTTDDLPAQHFSLVDTVRGHVVATGEPVRDVIDGDGMTASGIRLDGIGPGPVLALPLLGISGPRGVLIVSRHQGRPAFTDAEMSLASSFAAQAGIALELADARELQEQTLLLLDRERIARDLHDHVIQELFSIGLRLDGAISQGEMSPGLSERIHECVEDLDRSIRRIRSTIFTLRGSVGGSGVDLRERVLGVTAGLQDVLGFAPAISFSGPVDTAVDADLAADVEACVREALTNIAKHAKATAAILDLALSQGRLVLTVADNGIGMPAERSRSSGLTNLQNRAREHGGDLSIQARVHGGTVLEWTAVVR